MSQAIKKANPGKCTRLEKVPAAAGRMGISVTQTYREINAGRLGPLVKIGLRASAIPSESVDAWIESRINASRAVSTAGKRGGRHDSAA